MPNIVIATIVIAVIVVIIAVIIAIIITVIDAIVAILAMINLMSLEVIATSGDLKEYLWTLERNLDADHQFKSLEESYRE